MALRARKVSGAFEKWPPGPVGKEKQFGLPDDFCKIDVTILSRMRHPASGFPVVFRELKQRRRRLVKNGLFLQAKFANL